MTSLTKTSKMIVEFMVEDNEYYNSELPFKVVEHYTSTEYPYSGYRIYRVITDDLTKIRVVNETSGIEYIPFETIEVEGGKVKYVSVWTPNNAE